MARVLRALPGEKRTIALKPWLYRIAHNEAVRLLRGRRPEVELEQGVADAAAQDPEARRALHERLEQLLGDLRELGDRQRSALVMRELNDLSYRDVAATLGVSEAAAKQLVYEARRALQSFAEGREMSCDDVTRAVSADDGRMLRALKLRAHLRDCRACREFRDAMRTRRADLGVLAPPLAAPAAGALLHSLLGGGGGGGTSSGVLGAGVVGGASQATAGALATKGIAAAVVAVAMGAGAVEVVKHSSAPPSREAAPAAAARADGAEPIRGGDDRAGRAGRSADAEAQSKRGAARGGERDAAERREGERNRAREGEGPSDRASRDQVATGVPEGIERGAPPAGTPSRPSPPAGGGRPPEAGPPVEAPSRPTPPAPPSSAPAPPSSAPSVPSVPSVPAPPGGESRRPR